MKKFYIFALLMALTLNASALSKSKSRRYSLYLSDKMAYELDLTSIQYDAVYQINYDYFRSVYTNLDVEYYWPIRDDNMFYVLDPYQYRVYTYIDYFYNPLSYMGSSWYLDVYSYYPSRSLFYRDYPTVYRSYHGAYIGNPSYYMYGTWAGPATYVNMHPSVAPPPPGQYNPHMDRHYEKFTNGTAARRGYTNPQMNDHGGSTRPDVNGGNHPAQPNTQQNFNGNGQPTTNQPTTSPNNNNYNTPTTNNGVSRAGNVPRNNNTTQPANQTAQQTTRTTQQTTRTTQQTNNNATQQSATTPTRSTGVSRSTSRSSSSSSSPSSTSSSRRSSSSSSSSSSYNSSSSSSSSSSRSTNTSRGSVSSGRSTSSSSSSSSGGTSRRR